MTTALLDLAAAEKSNEKGDMSAAESTYLLLSSSGANLDLRTGRWADEELDFCDFLMQAFDKGLLPMASGARLNDFLCNMLLCKASRLTKKMKNARLSSRSYQVVADPNATLDFAMFTQLQERFLESVSCKSTRLELQFHMNKMWRTNLSNLCVQIGSQLLDAEDWLTSLDALERRGVEAEDNLRKARRRRMGLALKVDATGSSGVFFSGVSMHPPVPNDIAAPAPVVSGNRTLSGSPLSTSSDPERSDHISSLLDIGEAAQPASHDHADDFAAFLDVFENTSATSSSSPTSQMSFLEQVMSYVESAQLPFQHVDVWVPSFQGKGGELRLYHAGHTTRMESVANLHEYGEYSTKFSFPSGVGLPGRVYATGKSSWECRLDLQDPKIFERAGGAKVYGVKTGVGIPLTSSFVGRLVLAMYSQEDLPLNEPMLRQMQEHLAPLCPKPRWKLVVEMDTEGPTAANAKAVPTALPAAMEVVSPPQSDREVDIELANLLTDHLPGAQFPAQSTDCGGLLRHYMSLRLLLLRDPDRRTREDSNDLDIIRKSYEAFTSKDTRSRKEIADLLVQDWKHLKAPANEHRTTDVEHKSLVMNAPRVQTYAPLGSPTRVPFALGVPADGKKRRRNSPDPVNIVDDSSSCSTNRR